MVFICFSDIYIFEQALAFYGPHQRSQTSYTAPCNGVISHGLLLGIFGFLSPTHTKTDAKLMPP